VPLDGQLAKFAYYTAVYVVLSLAMTVLSVPYLALQPEMALGYDARTSLNTYRNVGSLLGVFAAISIRPVAHVLGGGEVGFARTGLAFGAVLALPWLAVWGATWERPEFRTRAETTPLWRGVALLARQPSFRKLVGLYLCGRVAMDLVGAMLILYFTYWIGRSDDFEIVMFTFLSAVMLALPFWLRVSRRTDKARIFVVGSIWWVLASFPILLAQPDWPLWAFLFFVPITAVGYAVVDLIPWSMLGEVVDEDDLQTGERREGLYNGVFMFVRKLAGTVAVWLAFVFLGWLGYTEGDVQNPAVVTAIRLLTALGPVVFLTLGLFFAWNYPLSRRRHEEIVAALDARNHGR
jgi:Na+/melibiose symporter-like transporter